MAAGLRMAAQRRTARAHASYCTKSGAIDDRVTYLVGARQPNHRIFFFLKRGQKLCPIRLIKEKSLTRKSEPKEKEEYKRLLSRHDLAQAFSTGYNPQAGLSLNLI
jgi:hypothetical protein